ncbi:hypothetical protein DDD63_01745 [Actinobaculum sp. 313]|nr:hypothetical protein DDD63_01745 [Actinobaculum sp. 313]
MDPQERKQRIEFLIAERRVAPFREELRAILKRFAAPGCPSVENVLLTSGTESTAHSLSEQFAETIRQLDARARSEQVLSPSSNPRGADHCGLPSGETPQPCDDANPISTSATDPLPRHSTSPNKHPVISTANSTWLRNLPLEDACLRVIDHLKCQHHSAGTIDGYDVLCGSEPHLGVIRMHTAPSWELVRALCEFDRQILFIAERSSTATTLIAVIDILWEEWAPGAVFCDVTLVH